MTKGNILIVLVLALLWITLVESFSIIAIASGIGIGVICVFFAKKYLPLRRIRGVSFGKLIGYPLYLLGQIFSSSLYVSKLILFGARTDIVNIETEIENDSLRVMLADSITLTPGSMLLELEDNKMTILWLRSKNDPDTSELTDTGQQIMGKLENKLKKAQK